MLVYCSGSFLTQKFFNFWYLIYHVRIFISATVALIIDAIVCTGDEKEHLKVTLLRIYSSLQGVMSCLPDMRPSYRNKGAEDMDHGNFLIAGAVGSSVGSSEMRERAAQHIHVACK